MIIEQKILSVLVNYGDEQLNYLEQVITELKSFVKYRVTIIVQSNIPLTIQGIDQLNIIKLDDYQFLPLSCRKVIWDNRKNFDIFIYGENDHLIVEKHIDRHLEYTKILPANRISGLIQYEENETGKYYPGYHCDFDWIYDSIEIYGGKKFAHFSNLHQATFILTKQQLLRVGKKFNFLQLVNDTSLKRRILNKCSSIFRAKINRMDKYSVKCKVNTDVYEYGGIKKMICISEFEDNIIHHLPNIYIDGLKGRNIFRSEEEKMDKALKRLLGGN
ncbi:MAG: hypothetical protein IT487_11190 [Chromatiaceae bacterium]|nr:hypothetical protein [Chromatiaceae bacterium]